MAGSAGLASLCSAPAFPFPDLPGAHLESVVATPIYNFTDTKPASPYFAPPALRVKNATFCNVTVSYTHPGQNDLINVRAFLPVASPAWNRRFQAVGGGGWSAGLDDNADWEMLLALAEGYATITTDAGDNAPLPDGWALVSEGNVDLYQLQNFASVSLYDEAVIGKSLVQSFYGEGPSYSYWSGCSQGGRQGYMLAQRYPDLYDGIAAAAPAIYLPAMLGSMYWSQVFIDTYLDGIEPDRCELDEVTAKAIAFCDVLDGFEDGLIADDEACLKAFDPQSLVGSSFLCATTNRTTTISQEAITFAKAVWEGPRGTDGNFLWYGPSIGAPLADSTRDSGTTGLGAPWLQYFVEKSSTYDMSNLTLEEYEWQMHRGVAEFDSIIGTSDPDLREFRRQGKKLLSYHGMVSTSR